MLISNLKNLVEIVFKDGTYLGAWFNGRISVSKTADEGSIPSAPATFRKGIMKRLFEFVKSVRREWFKIVWPDRNTVTKTVIMVFAFSGLAVLFFFITDSLLNKLVTWIF